jgi:hypothetical protein
LNSIWAVNTAGLLSTAEDCPISEFKLCEDVDCNIETPDSWYSFEDSKLIIDVSNGIPFT